MRRGCAGGKKSVLVRIQCRYRNKNFPIFAPGLPQCIQNFAKKVGGHRILLATASMDWYITQVDGFREKHPFFTRIMEHTPCTIFSLGHAVNFYWIAC